MQIRDSLGERCATKAEIAAGQKWSGFHIFVKPDLDNIIGSNLADGRQKVRLTPNFQML